MLLAMISCSSNALRMHICIKKLNCPSR